MSQFNKEQIYIVTGASSGLGKATALMLNEQGATVVAIARNEQRLNELKNVCKYPENLHIEIKDLTDDIDNLPNYVKNLKEKYGKFSGMAYCAGITSILPIRSIDYQEANRVFDINYFSPLMMLKGIVDKRNNIGRGTSVVLISSIAASINSKGETLYNSSKAAIISLVSTVAKEYLGNEIRVNCVSPSMIETPMIISSLELPDYQDNTQSQYPFGFGEPNDVANVITFLLSDKAKFISGQNYIIDSGGVL